MVKNLIQKFASDARLLKEAIKILKSASVGLGGSVPDETVQLVKDAYEQLKQQDYASVLR